MNYILDTHALIWALTDTAKLSSRVKKIIAEDDASLIYVSTISLWEISIKYGLKCSNSLQRETAVLSGNRSCISCNNSTSSPNLVRICSNIFGRCLA